MVARIDNPKHLSKLLAVKIAKRMLIDSTNAYGRLCQDHRAQAMLTHQNTPKLCLQQ